MEVLDDLPGFNVFRNDRQHCRGGGVLIAVKDTLPCSVVANTRDFETLWLLFRSTPQVILLGVCYRPPRASSELSDKLNCVLDTLTKRYANAHILLFGDFNFPHIKWNDNPPSSLCQVENSFLDVCFNYNSTQLVSENTRVTQDSAAILDLILTNNPSSLSSMTQLKEISDHKVIHAAFAFAFPKQESWDKTIRLYGKGN